MEPPIIRGVDKEKKPLRGLESNPGFPRDGSPSFEYVPKQINEKYEYSDVDQIKNNNLDKWMNLYQFNLNELSMIQPTYSFKQTNNRCPPSQCRTVGGSCRSLGEFEP
ncbi:unnamed protein product [Didymodactylos carnosus]|nr:unnamed protein product [Didymodactylos carnosus]CAF4470324.1 unnamed protein product [Didymodactylos carnosus]